MNFLLGWNPLVMPKYGMVDYDIAEIAALEAVLPDIKVYYLPILQIQHWQSVLFYENNLNFAQP